MKDCVFCDREKIKTDILYETDNFFVKVGFGIIVPGHVMIVPKMHLDCLAQLPDELREEYIQLKILLIKKIKVKFSEPFLIEYGNTGSISHAHIHFIPLKGEDYKIKSIMAEMVSGGNFEWEEVDWKKIKEIYQREKRYVLIEEKGKIYWCHVVGMKYQEKLTDIHLDYRGFFVQKGVFAVQDWEKLSVAEKIVDEEKRIKTKSILRF